MSKIACGPAELCDDAEAVRGRGDLAGRRHADRRRGEGKRKLAKARARAVLYRGPGWTCPISPQPRTGLCARA